MYQFGSTAQFESRTYDGSFNNLVHPAWGKAEEALLRLAPSRYYGGASEPSGPDRPNPRVISNIVCVSSDKPPHPELTDFMWAWGQFLDHELDLSLEDENETLSFRTPANDPVIPNARIPFHRSEAQPGTGDGANNPRQQVNVLSSYIDAANVYGASETRAAALRRLDGSGKLKTTKTKKGEMPPLNEAEFPNAIGPSVPGAPRDPKQFYIAGDVRANEHGVLLCMHTLWIREHNQVCDEVKDSISEDDARAVGRDEAIYQTARRIVGAKMQAIVFYEFLPALLGPRAMSRYDTYKPNLDATISNLFTTACYRLGHSMLSPELLLQDTKRGSKPTNMPLRETFFRPDIVTRHGITPFLNGLARQKMQQMDTETVEDIRSFLFNVAQPKSRKRDKELLDLAALNIIRGRDHGLPDLNTCREALGLRRYEMFEQITDDEETVSRLKRAYDGEIDHIDPWIGGLAEKHVDGAIVGELFYTVLKDQFDRCRDGDRFWFENDPAFTKRDRSELKKMTLGDVLRRNTDIKIQGNVFSRG